MSSSATATRWRSIWPPIPLGGPRSTDPEEELALARAMLAWRMEHADRTLTGMLVEDGGLGRWPPMPPNWGGAAERT